MRVQFHKGFQRKFIKEVIKKLNCPSLRELVNRGIDVNYSTLKNYYHEDRLISEVLFNELINICELNKNDFSFKIIGENWGQVKGGKVKKLRARR